MRPVERCSSTVVFGWHRPPTVARWAPVDMRHRSTPGDRPTVRAARETGSNPRPPARADRRQPVDDGLPRRRAACYVRGHRGSPPIPRCRTFGQRRWWRGRRRSLISAPLTCDNDRSHRRYRSECDPGAACDSARWFTDCGQLLWRTPENHRDRTDGQTTCHEAEPTPGRRSRRGAGTPTSTSAWRSVVDDLQPNQRAWLRASEPVTLHESTAIIAVPNDFTRSQLEGRLRAQLEDALTESFGREIRLAVTRRTRRSRTEPPHGRRSRESTSSTWRHVDKSSVLDDVPPAARLDAGAATRRSGSSRPDAEPRRSAHGQPRRWRPGSTRSTPSRPSSSAPPTGSRTRPPSPSPRRRARPTTRCSSTATPGWARPTCCTPSVTTCAASTPAPRCATSPARSSPTSSSTRSATTGRTGSSGATATSTCC